MQRLLARYPLHADLSAPVALSVQALLHGLQLLHRGLQISAPSAGLALAPQAPAHEPGGLKAALPAAHEPEVACWWLRWTALTFESPSLAAPKPREALEMLRRLSALHQEDENQRAASFKWLFRGGVGDRCLVIYDLQLI